MLTIFYKTSIKAVKKYETAICRDTVEPSCVNTSFVIAVVTNNMRPCAFNSAE